MKLAAAAGGLGAAGWAAYTLRERMKPVPGEEELDRYWRGLLAEAGLDDYHRSWRDESLAAGGRRLHLYLFESAPGDPSVVFVPGTSVYAPLYVEFLVKLSRLGFNVVGFDPRGHGLSEGARGSYTLGGLVEDARAVIDYAVNRYGENVAIAGSSQGGMTSFYCAAADPRLKAAVCHNLIAPDEPDNYRMTRWPGLYRRLLSLAPLALRMPGALLELRTPVRAYLDLQAETCAMFPDVGRFLRRDPLVVNAVSFGALVSLATTPLERPVEEIKTPVMVLHGGRDNIFPEDYVRRVYDRLTCDKRFLYLPLAHHLVLIDNVDEVAGPVAGWLRERFSA